MTPTKANFPCFQKVGEIGARRNLSLDIYLVIWKALPSASKSEGGWEVTEKFSLYCIGLIFNNNKILAEILRRTAHKWQITSPRLVDCISAFFLWSEKCIFEEEWRQASAERKSIFRCKLSDPCTAIQDSTPCAKTTQECKIKKRPFLGYY